MGSPRGAYWWSLRPLKQQSNARSSCTGACFLLVLLPPVQTLLFLNRAADQDIHVSLPHFLKPLCRRPIGRLVDFCLISLCNIVSRAHLKRATLENKWLQPLQERFSLLQNISNHFRLIPNYLSAMVTNSEVPFFGTPNCAHYLLFTRDWVLLVRV